MNDIMFAQYVSCFISTTYSYSHTYKHITNSCQVYLGSLVVQKVSKNPWRLLEWCLFTCFKYQKNNKKITAVQTQ